MLDHLKNYQVILASQSPRRRELLQNLGIDFQVHTQSGIDEDYPPNLSHKDIALYLAAHKANAYTEFHVPGFILITADTIVCQGDKVLNKPRNYQDAFAMLSALAQNTHQVITGMAVTIAGKMHQLASSTTVHFNSLEKAEIDYYIKTYQPYDKAGAYGIQEWMGYVGVDKIEGSYFNVMGLPVQELYQLLKTHVPVKPDKHGG